ncbi:putative sterigmatocystin biosynthesis P450 monooxygenase stcS [Echria macrotheca]|uniref:Sterigmatocystin biosynthesis P450 monooxygenase stcS n=1 Tax=Echria macrotheca TaxID=438768 RepID=A0AAJ0B8V3_9PEZI|nr:putative sterigmatocystin biosynthesis P450 monooxygenase stcS [Echria macrotheca]
MPSTLVLALTTLAIASAGYWIAKIIALRGFYRTVPCPPHSFVWGHLKLIDEYNKKFPPETALPAVLTQINQDFNLPDIWYLDLWPFGPQFVMCSAPDAAAMPTTIQPMEQAPVVEEYFGRNLGKGFMEVTNGPTWKELHHMIAPALTPAATRTYHEMIVEEAKVFYDQLQKWAAKDEPVNLIDLASRYTYDVINRVFYGDSGERANAQTTHCQFLDDLSRLSEHILVYTLTMNPLKKRSVLKQMDGIVARMEREVEDRANARFAVLRREEDLSEKLSPGTILDRMLAARAQSGKPLDDRLMGLVRDNAKGVVAAGFNTTADTLVNAFILLAAFPDILAKMRDEHTHVFSPSFDETLSLLRSNPNLVKNLEYTTAFIHETLRIFPVGNSVRKPPKEIKSFTYKSKTYPIRDHIFMVLTHAMHHDPSIFPEPKRCLPERHLPLSSPPYPRSAYRPFERGPRSCLGSTLAVEEMRIALLMVARWFDFEHLVHGKNEVPLARFTDLDTKIGDAAFPIQRFTIGPRAPVEMKLTRRM